MRTRGPIKTLLVGCGRMGAGSGGRSQRLESHAGVLSRLPSFDVTLFDQDFAAARNAARVLRLSAAERLDRALLEESQCAVICSPTETHAEYVSRFLRAGVPLIVCEKPGCASLVEAKRLQRLATRSTSRVVVNYTRRFQPAYAGLRRRLLVLAGREALRAIEVRYQRGFLNNASHAFDLIRFLTGWNIAGARLHSMRGVHDEFRDDPTVSALGEWNGGALSIIGLAQVRFSLFEIDFFFERSAVRLRDRGDTIELSGSAEPQGYYAPLVSKAVSRGNIRTPLENLYRHVQRMIRDTRIPGNLTESLQTACWAFGMLRHT